MEIFVTDNDFLNSYKNLSPEDRVILLMDNYNVLPKLFKKMETQLEYKVIAERDYMISHRRELNKCDVKVQTSKISNPTEDEAIFDYYLDESLEQGKLSKEILMQLENSDDILSDINVLKVMKMDFKLLNDTIGGLNDLNEKIFRAFLEKKKQIKDVAIDVQLSYSGIRKKIVKIREDVIKDMVPSLSLSFR